jgi:hypothetical protein
MRCSLGLSVALLLSHSAFALKDGTPVTHGDCHTGCWQPLETKHYTNMTFNDCLNWFKEGCPNNVWPGHAEQVHPNCFPGANAVSYAKHDGSGVDNAALCRIWTCTKEPIYDGNTAFTCIYNPDHVLPDAKNPVTKAYYPPLQNTCLKDVPGASLSFLNGVMTPDQATAVCMQYQNADPTNATFDRDICAGFWYDQKKKETTPDSAPSAPCNIGLEQISNSPVQYRVTNLTGDCYLRKNGDERQDALGGCGYDNDDSQCCLNDPNAKDGTCTHVLKQCGHITFDSNSGAFTFKTCGNDTSIVAKEGEMAKMSSVYGAANGYVTCSQLESFKCSFNLYENRFRYYFYSQFVPTTDTASCGTGDSTLLRSGDEEKVPIAIQTAYRYLAKQVTADHPAFLPGGSKVSFCEDTPVSYAHAWNKCMSFGSCLTFEYQCPTAEDGSQTCQACHSDPHNFNKRCFSKFPSSSKFCYSSFDYKDNSHSTSAKPLYTYAVYAKMQQVTSGAEDSDPTVIMT